MLPFLTVAQAAEALNLSVSKTYRMVASGELPCQRFGRAVRIPSTVISELMNPLGALPSYLNTEMGKNDA